MVHGLDLVLDLILMLYLTLRWELSTDMSIDAYRIQYYLWSKMSHLGKNSTNPFEKADDNVKDIVNYPKGLDIQSYLIKFSIQSLRRMLTLTMKHW